ncbi:hypothetical protein EVAR_65629_1 [Eumeta japonica]|uniref:Uncharacterized protein n=1 Tax=Eumeta variegata TaxID=151549 RepID=A0A4C1Z437_EUMVA|nr:hypothetical protein EVAR_65629_1 [Eumeta japonica]
MSPTSCKLKPEDIMAALEEVWSARAAGRRSAEGGESDVEAHGQRDIGKMTPLRNKFAEYWMMREEGRREAKLIVLADFLEREAELAAVYARPPPSVKRERTGR